MGFAVAERLYADGFRVAILDLNEKLGEQAARKLGSSAMFAACNVTSYDLQLKAFEKVWEAWGRIDFVFANAGVIEKAVFYDKSQQWPPAAANLLSQDILLTGVVYSSYLAMHFMRRNSPAGGVLVMTASGV